MDDEQTQAGRRSGMRPELISEQVDDREHLIHSVVEEMAGMQVLRPGGKLLHEVQEMRGNQVMRILDRLLPGEASDQAGDGACADARQHAAADALEQRISAV